MLWCVRPWCWFGVAQPTSRHSLVLTRQCVVLGTVVGGGGGRYLRVLGLAASHHRKASETLDRLRVQESEMLDLKRVVEGSSKRLDTLFSSLEREILERQGGQEWEDTLFRGVHVVWASTFGSLL